jgi:glycine/D-amino acid oxidase-like deaminating enzyme
MAPPPQGPLACDFAVIGTGFTGLAAAHRLAALRPEARILLLEAERAGEGASARNSGFIVDSTLNDGVASPGDKEKYLAKYRCNEAGGRILRNWVEEFGISCGWDPTGKYHAAHDPKNFAKLERFARLLQELEIDHALVSAPELRQALGTGFYGLAVKTQGGVLVNPARLARGLLEHLPENVSLYEETPVLKIERGRCLELETPHGIIAAKGVICCVNALMPLLGFCQDRVMGLTLTASLTEPLSLAQRGTMGDPRSYGVLPVDAMGATLRFTEDHRLMIRNTVEYHAGIAMNAADLETRKAIHREGLKRRFPQLGALPLARSWSGSVCVSRNGAPVFEELGGGLYLAGCYNAGGLAMGTLFGWSMAELALGEKPAALADIRKLGRPSRLPPAPLRDCGMRASLAWKRRQGRSEN